MTRIGWIAFTLGACVGGLLAVGVLRASPPGPVEPLGVMAAPPAPSYRTGGSF